MKITQLTSNYKLQQSKPETSKQASSTCPIVDEKQVFKFLSSNAIAFQGQSQEEKELTTEQIHKKLIDKLSYINDNNYDENKQSSSFTKLINNKNFDYKYQTDGNSIYSISVYARLEKLIRNGHSADRDLYNYFKKALFIKILNNPEPLPNFIKNAFNDKEGLDSFMRFWGCEETEKYISEEDLTGALKRLKDEFKIDYEKNPDLLSSAVSNNQIKHAKALYYNGADPEKKYNKYSAMERAKEKNLTELIDLFNNEALININKSLTFDDKYINYLKNPKTNLDEIKDNKSIEEMLKETVQNPDVLAQFLSTVEKIRNTKSDFKFSPNEEKLFKLVNLKLSQALDLFLNVNKDIDLNKYNENGDTILHVAYKNNDWNMLDKFINHPELNINATDLQGNTIGILASKDGNIELLNKFIENSSENFNPNYINYIGKTPSTILNSAKTAKTLEKVLQLPGIDINLSNEYMDPAIIQFAKEKNIQNFTLLLKHPDIDIEKKDINGKTVFDAVDNIKDMNIRNKFLKELQAIADKKPLNQIKSIIEAKGIPSIDVLNNYLDYSNIKEIINNPISSTDETIAHFITEIKPNEENIMDLIDLYEKFKNANPDINQPDRFGLTPLMKAVNGQNALAIEFLLNNGAKTDIKNQGGETAIDMANITNNEKLKNLFKKYN